jgi:ribonuclease PH
VVLLEPDRFVEVQGTGEAGTFARADLDRLLDLAHGGVAELFRMQRAALGW